MAQRAVSSETLEMERNIYYWGLLTKQERKLAGGPSMEIHEARICARPRNASLVK